MYLVVGRDTASSCKKRYVTVGSDFKDTMVSSVAYIIIINVSVRTRIFYVFFIFYKRTLVRFLKTGAWTGGWAVAGFSFSTGKCGRLLKFIGCFIILGYQDTVTSCDIHKSSVRMDTHKSTGIAVFVYTK